MRSKLNSQSLKIIVCCHKPCELPDNSDGVFLPVFAGAALKDNAIVEEQLQRWQGARDDKLEGAPCDNISAKNKSFCEMTAIYWAWKNIKALFPSLEYIGVNHYRRYFSFNRRALFREHVVLPEADVLRYKADLGKLEGILSCADALLVKWSVAPMPLDISFSYYHVNSADIKTIQSIMHKKCPGYDRELYDIMLKGNKYSPCNMCVMGWERFASYCEWVFDILFEAERHIDTSRYNPQQRRLFGYMAEILLNVWVAHNGLKVKRLPSMVFSDEPKRSALYNAIRLARNSLSAPLLRPLYKFTPEAYAQTLKRHADELERMK